MERDRKVKSTCGGGRFFVQKSSIILSVTSFSKKQFIALAGWLHWLEHCPIFQKVLGLIPNQYLGCGFDPKLGIYGRQYFSH